MPLVTTPSAVDATSYSSRADAVTRAGLDPRGATWAAIVDENTQDAWLAMATTDIDGALVGTGRLPGTKADADQALELPRGSDTTIPRAAVIAAQLLAFHYAERGSVGEIGTPVAATNIKRDKTGPLETEYFAPPTTITNAIDALPAHVRVWLNGLLAPDSARTWGAGVVVRGS